MKSQKLVKKKQDKTLPQKETAKPKPTQLAKEDKDNLKSTKILKSSEKIEVKQSKETTEVKKEKENLGISRKQVKQTQQIIPKQEQIRIANEVVELEIESMSMAPCNSNVTLVRVLQEYHLQSPILKQFYQKNLSRLSKFIISPVCLDSSKAIYAIENMTKYTDVQIKLTEVFIFNWLIQILYSLHPVHNKLKQTAFYPKITKKHIYLTKTPSLQSVFLRDQNYLWDNPFRVAVLDTVQNQSQFFEQMILFDEKFAQVKEFSDLNKFYNDYKFAKFKEEVFSVENIGKKIKEQLRNTQDKSDLGLNTQELRWLQKQLNISKKYNLHLFYKASQCCFDPYLFWSQLKTIEPNQNQNQLLVLRIESQTGNDKLVGFYSSMFTKNPDQVHPKFLTYIPDEKKTSILINISQRTTHHLNDAQYALGYGKQILLCIGKCDIILSAFNVTNLCYFPVNYEPDTDHICSSADTLCGSKFKLKQLYVYRVAQNMGGS